MSTSQPDVDAADGQLGGRAWGLLFVLCGALFLDALDVSMVNVALPSISSDLDMSTRELQWVVSAYVLGYGGFLLLGGRAADLFGRRRMFLGALAVFLVFSGLGGLATDGSLLVSSWAGQAIYRIGSDGSASTVVENVESPADIGFDTRRHRLLIPIFSGHRIEVREVH